MIEDVKTALRITVDAFDGEITDLIDAALSDLAHGGVIIDPVSPLVKRAVVVYCKAYFGYDNPDADRLADAYIAIKKRLMVYGGEHHAT